MSRGVMLGALALVMIAGCQGGGGSRPVEESKMPTTYNHVYNRGADDIYEVKYDGCTYLLYNGSGKGGLIHSATCPNSLHTTRRE